jgi:hypothetical protein
MPLWLGNGFGFNFPVAGSQGDISEETAQLWIRPAVSRGNARLPQRQRQPARGAPEARRGTSVQANVAGWRRY